MGQMDTPAGLVTIESRFGPRETMERAITEIGARGISVLARIDHAASAQKAGLDLPPTEVVIFGNPKAGTPLMQTAQTMGIDLPLKILVWQDPADRTWLSYNDPHWLAERHGAGTPHGKALDAMTAALAAIAAQATR